MRSTRLAILIGTLLWLHSIAAAISGAIITEWNFNSAADDSDVATGTTSVSRGDGAFTVIGELTSNFGTVGGGATSDAAASDNSQIRLRSFPPADSANKTAGVEFTINTTGYEKIALAWDQYNSATASRYWRVQYTRDGFEWFDHGVVTNTNASKWLRFLVSFAEIPAVNDRPYLGIRLVQEFESTAMGFGLDQYVAIEDGRSYSRSGTCWIDMVSITGRVIGSTNEPPMIATIGDIDLEEGESSGEIDLSVTDVETPVEQLVVTATSSLPEVATVEVQGEGGEYDIVLHGKSVGESSITARVVDGEGDFAETVFKVVVRQEQPVSPANFFLLWNFNSFPEDADPSTGSFETSAGLGHMEVVGTDNFSFGMVGQGATSDPAEVGNSMLRIASFPSQGTGEATCGIEFFGSTVGFRDLVFVWDQYNSGSASRYWRVQVTTNGTDFFDQTTITNTSSSRWRRSLTVGFNGVPGVENNPNFGIRLVAIFAPGGATYEPVSAANYSAAGTLWLDWIGLAGEAIAEDETVPQLRVAIDDGVQISWPAKATDYELEARRSNGGWAAVEGEFLNEGEEFRLRIEALDEGRWFRLKKKPGL